MIWTPLQKFFILSKYFRMSVSGHVKNQGFFSSIFSEQNQFLYVQKHSYVRYGLEDSYLMYSHNSFEIDRSLWACLNSISGPGHNTPKKFENAARVHTNRHVNALQIGGFRKGRLRLSVWTQNILTSQLTCDFPARVFSQTLNIKESGDCCVL